jgi:hypothetical protein
MHSARNCSVVSSAGILSVAIESMWCVRDRERNRLRSGGQGGKNGSVEDFEQTIEFDCYNSLAKADKQLVVTGGK